MTLRPLGPRVDLTASASWSTPASSRPRASAPKRSSLARNAQFLPHKFESFETRCSCCPAPAPAAHALLPGGTTPPLLGGLPAPPDPPGRVREPVSNDSHYGTRMARPRTR